MIDAQLEFIFQMDENFQTLEDLRGANTSAMDKPLMVTVVATAAVTEWKKGSVTRNLQKFVVVDANNTDTAPMLAISYAPTEDISRDNILILEAYLYRMSEDKLVLTNKTKVDLGPIDTTRARAVQGQAEALLYPSAETVSISTARTSPAKRTLSVEGQVVKVSNLCKLVIQ